MNWNVLKCLILYWYWMIFIYVTAETLMVLYSLHTPPCNAKVRTWGIRCRGMPHQVHSFKGRSQPHCWSFCASEWSLTRDRWCARGATWVGPRRRAPWAPSRACPTFRQCPARAQSGGDQGPAHAQSGGDQGPSPTSTPTYDPDRRRQGRRSALCWCSGLGALNFVFNVLIYI